MKEPVITRKYGIIYAHIYGKEIEACPNTTKMVRVGFIRKDNKRIRVHKVQDSRTGVYYWVSTWDYPGDSYFGPTRNKITSITIYRCDNGTKVRFTRENSSKTYYINTDNRSKLTSKITNCDIMSNFKPALVTCGRNGVFITYRKDES